MENQENSLCICGCGDYGVVSCSGACDLGHISDLVARQLNHNKVRKMSCLALIASGLDEKFDDLKNKNMLVIDGCSEDCGFKIMNNRGFDSFVHLRLTDLGYEKGKTPLTDETIKTIYEKAEILY